MNYCVTCQKITNNCEEETFWNNVFNLVIVHCEECGNFKYQYLKNITEIQNSD